MVIKNEAEIAVEIAVSMLKMSGFYKEKAQILKNKIEEATESGIDCRALQEEALDVIKRWKMLTNYKVNPIVVFILERGSTSKSYLNYIKVGFSNGSEETLYYDNTKDIEEDNIMGFTLNELENHMFIRMLEA